MALLGGNLGFSNPTKELLGEALHLYGKDAHVSSVISLGLGRPPPMAFPTAEVHQQEQWNKFLLQIVTDGETVSRELLARVYHLGIYFRFSTPNTSFGPHTDYGTHGNSDFLVEDIHTYIADSSPNLDHCVSVLKNSLGVVTLDQLRKTPGRPWWMDCYPHLNMESHMNKELWSYPVWVDVERLSWHLNLPMSTKKSEPILYSEANIKADLVANVRSLGAEYSQESFEGAMGLLQGLFNDWLLIYDNVDDPSLDLADLLPQCTHGSIIITTRNPSLGDLSSSTPLEMDVMSEEEAVAALLSAAIPKPKKPTMDEVAMSIRIVEELGYLPVAIIQAGSLIRQRKCFPDYLNRLRANRLKLLQTPATAQRDRHSHSVYATLETTKLVLPFHVIQLLHLLSYYHHSNILVNGMTLAAERSFLHQTFNFLERPLSFEQSISLLKEIFWTFGLWDSEEFDDNLLILQKYSLITTVRNEDKLIVRLHPLTQAWARDTLEAGKTKLYEEAAIR
ncbi:9600_t:CDS:2, partial [Acaulospora colombiana]